MSAPRLLLVAVAVAALGAFTWRADNYHLYVLALVGLSAIVGVGLNVLLGLCGQISLGHVAFYAIGAYAVGILTTKTADRLLGARCRLRLRLRGWPAPCSPSRPCACAGPISPW